MATCTMQHLELVRINKDKGFNYISCPDCKETLYIGLSEGTRAVRQMQQMQQAEIAQALGMANQNYEMYGNNTIRYSDDELALLHALMITGDYVRWPLRNIHINIIK